MMHADVGVMQQRVGMELVFEARVLGQGSGKGIRKVLLLSG